MEAKRLFCLACTSLLLSAGCAALLVSSKKFQLAPADPSWVPLASPELCAFERAQHPIYPYSVIMGGAYSPPELRLRIEEDPVVKSHYSDFDVNHSFLVKLTRDWHQYVSLRRRDPGRPDTITWTQQKVRLRIGEVLLTDGIHFARTRCGNRCSTLPRRSSTPTEVPELKIPLPPTDFDELRSVTYGNVPPLGPEGASVDERTPSTPESLLKLFPAPAPGETSNTSTTTPFWSGSTLTPREIARSLPNSLLPEPGSSSSPEPKFEVAIGILILVCWAACRRLVRRAERDTCGNNTQQCLARAMLQACTTVIRALPTICRRKYGLNDNHGTEQVPAGGFSNYPQSFLFQRPLLDIHNDCDHYGQQRTSRNCPICDQAQSGDTGL